MDLLGNLSDIEASVSELLGNNPSFSFGELLNELMSGNMESVGQMLWQMIREQLSGGLYENQQLLFKIAGLAIIGAIFANFAMAFSKEQVAETGFYLTYTLLMTLLMSSFIMTSGIVAKVLEALIRFMKILLPTFCTALTITSGGLLSAGYYEVMMIAIAVVEWLMAGVFVKMVQAYILVSLVNHISKQDYLSKLSELLESIIKWGIRTGVGIILGLNTIQTMLLPAIDRAKNTAAYRIISVVPGAGNAMNAAAGALVGSGVLIRNVLGIGGLIIIIIICILPMIRVCAVWLSYRVVQAVIQPVSDKRFLEGIESVTAGVGMLMQILFGCMLMFILSLAVVCNAITVINAV